MLDFPKKTVSIVVEDNEYELKFPTNGELIRIQSLKAELSYGKVGQMLDAETADSLYAVTLLDMQAHFTVLCPQLIEDLNVKSISELDAIDGAKLVKIYIDQFLPWYREWRDILQNGGVPVEKKEKKDTKKTVKSSEVSKEIEQEEDEKEIAEK